MMNFFLLKQIDSFPINKKEIIKMEDISIYNTKSIEFLKKLDFIGIENLISHRFQLLLELFLPHEVWEPFIFIDKENGKQETFWYLKVEECFPAKVEFSVDGSVSGISVSNQTMPNIFKVVSKKRILSILIDFALGELIIRRKISGLQLIPINSL